MVNVQDDTELKEWMRKMEETCALQVKYAKRQCNMASLGAICSICILLIVVGCIAVAVPRISSAFGQVEAVMGKVETVMEDMGTVVEDLRTASSGLSALSETDLTEMLDMDALNETIADLKAVVEPLAKLMRK